MERERKEKDEMCDMVCGEMYVWYWYMVKCMVYGEMKRMCVYERECVVVKISLSV